MKYALERLEELITQSYSPALYKGKPFTEHQLPEWTESVTKEIKNITTHLRRRAYDITNERSFELLIHQYQNTIIHLLDKVYAYKNLAENIVLAGAYLLIQDQLTELLSFITKRFSLYFNINGKVPEIYLKLSKERLKEALPDSQKRLSEKKVNRDLIKISLSPINTFIRSGSKEIIYKDLLYIKELCKQLHDFSKSPHNPRIEADKEMTELLIYMNVNSSEFTSYLFDSIDNSINEKDEESLKIEKLSVSVRGTHS